MTTLTIDETEAKRLAARFAAQTIGRITPDIVRQALVSRFLRDDISVGSVDAVYDALQELSESLREAE